METPNFKCPRSGRILTPLSMDYWRLKKKLNRLLSESSSSEESSQKNQHSQKQTPLQNHVKLSKKTPAQARAPRLLTSGGSDEDQPSPTQSILPKSSKDETTFARTSASTRTPKTTGNFVNDESSDEDFVIKRKPRLPRRAQKFLITSSSGDSEQENRSPSRSAPNETEFLSEALASTKIASSSSSPPTSENPGNEFIEISSDSDSLLSLNYRVKKNDETPPPEGAAATIKSRLSLTEPKRRIMKGINSGSMPPPTATRENLKKGKTRKGADEESEYDVLLENLTHQKHDEDDYDESQVDLNNTIGDGETVNLKDREFLISLDDDVPLKSCHPTALVYRNRAFNSIKEELAEQLFLLYERAVFQKRFDHPIPISWNVRMLKTAGFCYYKRGSNGVRSARIELSPKVVDRVSRLRDTLLHELCHAAAWLIHGYRDGHGPLFKFWSHRAHQLLGLAVTTTHTYVIKTKYVYRCKGCANEVGRHSKSLDTTRFRCSICKNQFELFVNKKHGEALTPATDRKPTPFTNFVRNEYRATKAASPHLSHGEVMTMLGERWKKLKNSA